jgi:hypothetical protein
MSWRIERVGIYSRTGELRPIDFQPQGLNIITGTSARGKSTVLDIINYCMMSGHCPIAKGVVRNNVSSVGLQVVHGRRRAVIVRPLPEPGKQTSSNLFFDEGNVELPRQAPSFNWSIDDGKEALGEFTGIEAIPVLSRPETDRLDRGWAAGIRHCVPYLLQPQDVIASRNVTFPGVEDVWHRAHQIDALPYFLGLLTLDVLRDAQRLRDLKTERNALTRELATANRLLNTQHETAYALLVRAAELGLTKEPLAPDMSLEKVLRQLRECLKTPLNADEPAPATSTDASELERRERALRTDAARVTAEIEELRRAETVERDLAGLAQSHIGRLRLVELLPEHPVDGNHCPLCGSNELTVDDVRSKLSAAVGDISAGVERRNARLSSRLRILQQDLQERLTTVSNEHARAQRQLVARMQEANSRESYVERQQRRSGLLGRIHMFLGLRQTSDSELRAKLDATEEAIRELESRVGERRLREQLERAQDKIGEDMTDIAASLDVEFPDEPCRLNLSQLRIEIAIGGKTFVPLSEFGSGANWVGYHIAATLALHKYLSRARSSVPQVLVLDQPSQAWFPVVRGPSRRRVGAPDRDSLAVRRVYEVLDQQAAQRGGPQVIAIDHASFDDTAFKTHVREDWHREDGLVPGAWLR